MCTKWPLEFNIKLLLTLNSTIFTIALSCGHFQHSSDMVLFKIGYYSLKSFPFICLVEAEGISGGAGAMSGTVFWSNHVVLGTEPKKYMFSSSLVTFLHPRAVTHRLLVPPPFFFLTIWITYVSQ